MNQDNILLTHILSEIKDLRKDVRGLLIWRWKIMGASALTSGVFAFVATIVVELMRH